MTEKSLTIWLAYVSYPVTTAEYFKRALARNHKVMTIGPALSNEMIKNWQLENMKLPILPLDIPTGHKPDMQDIWNRIKPEFRPDLYLWVESVHGYYPDNISQLNIPKACYFIDSHLALDYQLQWARNFDYVFIAQIEYIRKFKEAGIENVFWLPLGCDPEIHIGDISKKIFDVGFVGSIGAPENRRYKLLKKIDSRFELNIKRCFWNEMSEHFAGSRIVFNNAILNDLNMRLFEVMSSGSFLLTDLAANSGQEEMFKDGEDLGIYTDDDILDKIEFYLRNEDIRERIARRGRQIIHAAHTYAHRLDELLNVSLNGKPSTPDPLEWRERSIGKTMINFKPAKPFAEATRSFVIPVLDMSPASPYNIVKLLDDLSSVQGNVIIIFNSVEMAEKLKNHPRVDYYAVMNENVGVARAWNIGLNISETPVTFILNSDLHVEGKSIDDMEKYLLELDKAAIVGPQGSFFQFETAKDLQYFDKGSFNYPIVVDAVSGFFFAVKTGYFNGGSLHFENDFTPCYFEEWDLGLQIKKAGLKSYIVPVTGYDHEWSGSIRALRTIKYMKKEETAGEIHQRNLSVFRNKWEDIRHTDMHSADIFVSSLVPFFEEKASRLISLKMNDKAKEFYQKILDIYPGYLKSLVALAGIEYRSGNLPGALELYNKISEIDPEYQIGLSELPEGSTGTAADLYEEQPEANSPVPDYYENPRPDIQQTVNPAARTLLDVGCGSGLMASELKEKLRADVWGIEYNAAAAGRASARLDKVFTGRVEDNIPNLPENYFDTVIFADVLEHLMDPASVLRNLRCKLTDNGELIASIPNVRFWGVIVNLLSGNWEYEDAGILDRTHLKFFTRNSIINMFSQAGYKIVNMYSNRVKIPDISPALLSAMASEGINVETLNSEAKDFQYIIRAVKS